MTIWIVALVLMGLWAAISYFIGAIRSVVMLLGVILGGVLAGPLGRAITPLFPKMGMVNPVWLWLVPPLAAFVLLLILAAVGAVFAQMPIDKYYKYRSNDLQRFRFDRMNNRLGACIGLVTGAICLLLLCVQVYYIGYFTVQFANDDTDPAWLRYLNKARTDLAGSGLDRVASSFDPMPKKYYQVADLFGFIYRNNPAVMPRLTAYPPLMTVFERQDVKDMEQDKEYRESLQGKASLYDIVNSPRTQGFINSPDLVQQLSQLDLDDFATYLRSGKSPKYDPIKILGRWDLDTEQIIIMAKKKKPDITVPEIMALRKLLAMMSAGTTFQATTDNKLTLTLKGTVIDFDKLNQLRAAAAPPPVAQPRPPSLGAGGYSGIPANLRQRYARTANPPPEPTPAPAAPAEPAPIKTEIKTFQGTWDGDGDNYSLTIQNDSGKTATTDATIEGDQLAFNAFGQPFVFLKQY